MVSSSRGETVTTGAVLFITRPSARPWCPPRKSATARCPWRGRACPGGTRRRLCRLCELVPVKFTPSLRVPRAVLRAPSITAVELPAEAPAPTAAPLSPKAARDRGGSGAVVGRRPAAATADRAMGRTAVPPARRTPQRICVCAQDAHGILLRRYRSEGCGEPRPGGAGLPATSRQPPRRRGPGHERRNNNEQHHF
jgi:hypothetical protein